jgi:Leucine-rich repeat (LRR) protein
MNIAELGRSSWQLMSITFCSLLLISCWLVVHVSSDCIGPISEVEYTALEALYDSTDGENWRWRSVGGGGVASHWHFPATLNEPCGTDTWDGLKCNSSALDDVGCYVSAVSLSEHNLVGPVPTAIGTLTQLEILDLSGNIITGSLPWQIGGMMSLLLLDVQNNLMSQQLPTELASLSALDSLYLNSNFLEGSIPTELGNMTHLFGLYLESNFLQLTVPTEFGSIRLLGELLLDKNYLSGSISTSLCSLLNLRKFSAFYNMLSGTLPSCLAELTALRMLNIFSNFFSGTLPPRLGDLTNLLQLSFETNFFTGYIPSAIFKLQNVEQFLLTGNYLSGTLSPLIFNLTSVYQFEVGANMLVGTIPPEIFNLAKLQLLFLNYNLLSHTVPDAVCACSTLEYFYVDYNNLIGTFPNNFVNSSRMKYVDLTYNLFTGTIPSTLYELRHLTIVSVTGNFFSGSISSAFSNLSDLELLNFGSCLFTGSFPEGLLKLTSLKGFTTELNYLSGSVNAQPSSKSVVLQALEIGTNFLSGTLPAGFADLVRLEDFIGSHNLFTGRVDFLFNWTGTSGLQKLEYIDLSNNALSGTIPESMFAAARFRPLSAVVLYQNCFTGSLPAAICQASNLTTLILDSVSSAPACDVRFTGLWKDLFKVVIGKRSLEGTIPDCIWSMRSLQTLHLAGNGLGGTLPWSLVPVVIPAEIIVDDVNDVNRSVYMLNDVSLGSNALTGTIPLSWQQWPWKSLDLSDNKLTGILSDGLIVNNTCSTSETITVDYDDYYYKYDDGGDSLGSPNSSRFCGSVDLTVNRLSGRIPGAFRYAEGVDILDGNLFDCNAESLPAHDPTGSEYVCGSSDFNNSLILWLCCLFYSVALLRGVYGSLLWTDSKALLVRLIANSDDELDAFDDSHGLHFSHSRKSISGFLAILRRVAALSLFLQCFYVCVCMTSYMGMKASEQNQHEVKESAFTETYTLSTHTYQYAWLSTAGYLHGSIPVAAVITYLFLSTVLVARFLSSPAETKSVDGKVLEPPSPALTGSTSLKWLKGSQAPSAGRETDASPPHSNAASVAEAGGSEGVDVTAAAVVARRVWGRLSWSAALRLLVLILIHAMVMISINILYIYVVLTGLSSNLLLFLVQLALSVFKLLWNRYYVSYVIATPAASASAQVTLTSVTVQCCSFMILFTFIVSPVLATFFSDNTCFRYFITGQPVVNSVFESSVYACYLLCQVECKSVCAFSNNDVMMTPASVVPSWQYSYQCSSSLVVNYTPVLLYSFAITGLLVPLLQYLYCRLSSDTVERSVPLRWLSGLLANSIYACPRNNNGYGENLVRRPRRLFNGVSVVSRAYMNVGVLITFGMASPLLSVAVCLDCINLYAGWKSLIIRYISIFVFPTTSKPSLDEFPANKQSNQENDQLRAVRHLEYLSRTTDVATADTLHAESVSADTDFANVLWMVVWTAGLFWGLFVFDMYGDIYGAVDGLCMILAPTVGGAVTFYLARRYRRLMIGCNRKSAYSGSGDTAFGATVRSPVFDPQCYSSVFDDTKL